MILSSLKGIKGSKSERKRRASGRRVLFSSVVNAKYRKKSANAKAGTGDSGALKGQRPLRAKPFTIFSRSAKPGNEWLGGSLRSIIRPSIAAVALILPIALITANSNLVVGTTPFSAPQQITGDPVESMIDTAAIPPFEIPQFTEPPDNSQTAPPSTEQSQTGSPATVTLPDRDLSAVPYTGPFIEPVFEPPTGQQSSGSSTGPASGSNAGSASGSNTGSASGSYTGPSGGSSVGSSVGSITLFPPEHPDDTSFWRTGNNIPVPDKIAYITIDDGPSRAITPGILDVLQQEGVRATFFVLPHSGVDDLYWRIINEGHEIGNHTYTHNYSRLYSDINNFREDVLRAEAFIMEKLDYRTTTFRYPGGSMGRASSIIAPRHALLEELGYRYFNWHIDIGDARAQTDKRAAALTDNVLNNTRGREQLIILMHDSWDKRTTLEALPMIIAGLREQGYSFDIMRNY